MRMADQPPKDRPRGSHALLLFAVQRLRTNIIGHVEKYFTGNSTGLGQK